jgi:Ankyrin repeats (many copies)
MTVATISRMTSNSPTSSPAHAVLDFSKSFGSPVNGTSLECDYDINPSVLYQAIEAKQWDHAAKFISRQDGAIQAATWVTRKEKNGKLRWRLLPIHAAIIFGSPTRIVEMLLQVNPTGAQQKDDQGMLPLHLAFRNDSDWEIVEELLTAFPSGVNVKDRKGRTPIQSASTKRATVMDLFSQISISSERQRAVTESRTALDARIAAMQESHINTLTNLKEEWELQHEAMEKELRDSKRALEVTSVRLEETSALLAKKTIIEVELTKKLEMVTKALQSVNESRVVDARAFAADSGNRFKMEKRLKELEETNAALVALSQSLLDQQIAVKGQIDKFNWENKVVARRRNSLLQELHEIHNADESDDGMTARDSLRSTLVQSNEELTSQLQLFKEKIAALNLSSP